MHKCHLLKNGFEWISLLSIYEFKFTHVQMSLKKVSHLKNVIEMKIIAIYDTTNSINVVGEKIQSFILRP